MLNVVLLDPSAKAPTVAYPREDLGYDLYALEDIDVQTEPTWVRTGIAVEDTEGHGFLIRDRSSMSGKGVFTHGGVIDAGYRGEIKINMTCEITAQSVAPFYRIHAGDKVAQMIPVLPGTSSIVVVDQLSNSHRGDNGFGSSGV